MKHKKLDLVILAGGRGTRINNITKKIPKPMIKFGGIPFLKYLINYYSRYNFENIYILSGYKHKFICNYFKKIKRVNSINIEIIVEKKPMGTGGALFNLKKKKINDFFLINGDSYYELDQAEFDKMYLTKKKCSMFLIKNINYLSNKTLSNFKLTNGQINKNKGNLMNSGIYFFKKKILDNISERKISLENDIIKKHMAEGKIDLFKTNKNKFFIDIGTYKNFKLSQQILRKKLSFASVFFDRDGVINKLIPYISDLKKFKLRKNVLKTFRYLNKNKINIFIITNQAGIAKGHYTEKKYLFFEKKIKKFFYTKGVYINDVKYCPFHPKGKIKKYTKISKYRKPGNFMIRDILNEWPIDLKKSIMIGDQKSDLRAAKSINLKFQYVENNILNQIKKNKYYIKKI
jgi:D,D-heptose 1,7-bisphosphate phosphatase